MGKLEVLADIGNRIQRKTATSRENAQPDSSHYRLWSVETINADVRFGKNAYKWIPDLAPGTQMELFVTGVRGRSVSAPSVLGSNTYRVLQFYSGPVPRKIAIGAGSILGPTHLPDP